MTVAPQTRTSTIFLTVFVGKSRNKCFLDFLNSHFRHFLFQFVFIIFNFFLFRSFVHVVDQLVDYPGSISFLVDFNRQFVGFSTRLCFYNRLRHHTRHKTFVIQCSFSFINITNKYYICSYYSFTSCKCHSFKAVRNVLCQCSPLPKDSVPREQLPMRDTMVFKSATRVPRVLHTTPHVPHSSVPVMFSLAFFNSVHLYNFTLEICF